MHFAIYLLLMVGFYTVLSHSDISVVMSATGFGVLVLVSISWLAVIRLKNR
jgi:heme A synthase